jgi:hypothetical protein
MVGKKAAKVAAGKQGAPTNLHDEELSKDMMQGRIPAVAAFCLSGCFSFCGAAQEHAGEAAIKALEANPLRVDVAEMFRAEGTPGRNYLHRLKSIATKLP